MTVAPQRSLLPTLRQGFATPSACTAALEACGLQAQDSSDALDADYVQLAESFLTPGPQYHVKSLTVWAEQLGLHRDILQTKLWRLLCAQVIHQNFLRNHMERQLAQSLADEHRLCYVDCVAYDETPMRANVKGEPLEATALPTALSEADEEFFPQALRQLFEKSFHNDPHQVKFFQMKQSCGVAFMLGDVHTRILLTTPCPLQILERGTAEVLKHCLLRSSGVSPASQAFKLCTRASTTDQGSSNIRAEKAIATDRGANWSTIHHFCEAHITSTCFGKTFDGLLASDVSGLIHCALSLRHGASLNAFRACLRAEVEVRLVVKRGFPPPSAQQHKAAMMQIFLAGQSELETQALLSKLPNGDWRNKQQVEFYLPLGSQATPSRAAIARLLAHGLVYALLRSKPKTWPRHRWTGAGEAVDELARLEAVHGLLTATYQRFVRKQSALQAEVPDTDLTVHVSEDAEATATKGPTPAASAPHPPSSSQGLDATQKAARQGAGTAEADSSPDEHAVNRKIASTWLETGPFAKLMLIRLGMEPLRGLMFNLLDQCSEDWELRQRSAVCVARQQLGEGAGGSSLQRDYVILCAAEGRLEQLYYQQLHKLYDAGVWEWSPEDSLTVAHRALAFKILSRQGCLVEQLLAFPHRQFPVCLFRLLNNPELADEFVAVPECLKDPWALKVQESHPTLSGPQMHQTLLLHAELMSTSIAVIEAKHASVRRQLKSRSVQTWSLQASTASAEWVAQLTRKSRGSVLSSGKAPVIKKTLTKKRKACALVSDCHLQDRHAFTRRALHIFRNYARARSLASYPSRMLGLRKDQFLLLPTVGPN